MATCPHGFPEDQCLICQTLGVGKARPDKAREPARARTGTRAAPALADDDVRPLPARQYAQMEAPRRAKRMSGSSVFLAGLALIVVGGLLVWAFGGLFRLAFHIFEYAAIAVLSGWVGYKLGHARGRHERQPRS